MNISDKIEIIRDLIAQRDDIDRQLEEYIGSDGPKQAPVAEERPAKGKKGKRQRLCSNCQKPGHIARHCPLHSGSASAAPGKKSKQKLTEPQFDELKQQQKGGTFASRDFASYRNLPLSEVNRAVVSESYEAYSNF